jgi:thiamine-monophosphate kinase
VSEPRSARGEFELIAAVRKAAEATVSSGVRLGIGDDAAVVAPPEGHELVVTTDLLVEERHFHADARGEDVGWKALAVSVSDVAAMGGKALWAVVSVALPESRTGPFADALTAGLVACAQRFGVALVGGDTTASPGPVVVNVTLVGCVAALSAVRRDGAQPGDAICVTGALGGSLSGRHLRPEPRQDEALSLVQGGTVHAMIDVSDGLSSDLGHVADASGVGARVFPSSVPIHPDARAASRTSGRSPLDHALHDGEDFELLFTVPMDRAARLAASGLAGTPVTCIGLVTKEPGLWLTPRAGEDGETRRLERRGHDHFRAR